MGFGGVGFREQGEAFGVALQDGVQQGGVARGGLLGDGGDAGAGGEADVAAVQRDFAGDGAQQGGLAGAVAADQADAAALVHGEVGTVQDGAATKADGGAGDDEERHGGRVIGRVGVGGQGWCAVWDKQIAR